MRRAGRPGRSVEHPCLPARESLPVRDATASAAGSASAAARRLGVGLIADVLAVDAAGRTLAERAQQRVETGAWRGGRMDQRDGADAGHAADDGRGRRRRAESGRRGRAAPPAIEEADADGGADDGAGGQQRTGPLVIVALLGRSAGGSAGEATMADRTITALRITSP